MVDRGFSDGIGRVLFRSSVARDSQRSFSPRNFPFFHLVHAGETVSAFRPNLVARLLNEIGEVA